MIVKPVCTHCLRPAPECNYISDGVYVCDDCWDLHEADEYDPDDYEDLE